MTARSIDALLDERSRLVILNATTEGHLWASEFLLHRARKYLLAMVAPTSSLAVARDTICEEIRELLAEDRPHPGMGVVEDVAAGLDGEGEDPDGPVAA